MIIIVNNIINQKIRRKNIKEVKIQKKFGFKDKIFDPYSIFVTI